MWGGIGIVAALGVDVGKHWYFKNFLESEIGSVSSNIVADKINLKFSPFASTIQIHGLRNKIDPKAFQVKELSLRQGINQFKDAHLQGSGFSLSDYVTAADVQGKVGINPNYTEWFFEWDSLHFISLCFPRVGSMGA